MDKYKEKLNNLFNFVDEVKKLRNKTPYRIRVDGRFIKLGNINKTVWYGIGPAKSALNCHLKDKIVKTILKEEGLEPDKWGWYPSEEQKRAWNEFMEWALDTKYIEFVEVTE